LAALRRRRRNREKTFVNIPEGEKAKHLLALDVEKGRPWDFIMTGGGPGKKKKKKRKKRMACPSPAMTERVGDHKVGLPGRNWPERQQWQKF